MALRWLTPFILVCVVDSTGHRRGTAPLHSTPFSHHEAAVGERAYNGKGFGVKHVREKVVDVSVCLPQASTAKVSHKMDSSEYEMVRNMTLLFFFEKLLDKGGPRTLHDLSCQFGAKGFTKEMRQIAGGSQSGLKKFLTQYPSLFTVDGDHVHVNAFNSTPSNASQGDSSKRDYAKEAVDYFVNKLLQYGAGTEVPIKSLLGHRSQASPEVRHISGQHVKEFHDFLCRYPEAFMVREDTVMLRQWEGREPQPFHELEEVKLDPKILERLYMFFAKAVQSKGPQLVDQLFQAAVSALPEDSYHHIFQTSQDLSTVLKMRSDTFHVQSNLVTLVNPNVKIEYDCEDYCNDKQNQANNNTNSGNNLNNNQLGTGSLVPLVPLAPPPTTNVQNQSLKQRVNSLVMRTLADNSEKDRNIVTTSLSPSTATTAPPAPTTQNVEAYKTKVLQSTRVILNLKESLQVIDDIFSRVKPGGPTVAVSMDCEGINLGTRGQLTSIQLGLMTGQAFIFDLVTCPSLVTAGGLQRLLESEDVVKVIHDCRGDSVNLFNQFGITLMNVFDTQAGHAILQLMTTGKPVYKVKNVSLNNLCADYGAPLNPLKDQLKNVYRRDQRYWARRPFTRDMMLYSAADVLSLVPHVYTAMMSRITPEYATLLAELCDEQVYTLIRPAEVKQRKKVRKLNCEISDLKSRLAQAKLSKNIVLSNREIRLLRYLDLTEEEKEKLRGSYKVARKLDKLEGRTQDRDSKSDDDDDDDDDNDDCYNGGPESNEFNSLESNQNASGKTTPSDHSLSGGISSPHGTTSQPTSLTESMQQVDEVLSDGRMDRLEKIERLEAILSAATSNTSLSPIPPTISERCCNCKCHERSYSSANATSPPHVVVGSIDTVSSRASSNSTGSLNEAACQTLSTGDIVITTIYFTQEEKEKEKTLTASPKK